MTARRNILFAISVIVVFAASVGFYITLDFSPQIAYARLFIDAGLAIGLIAMVLAFYREKVMPTEVLVHALRELKNKKFKTKIDIDKLDDLRDVANAINELAVALALNQEKQEEIRRSLREELLPELKQKVAEGLAGHSFHPELGPVRVIRHDDQEQDHCDEEQVKIAQEPSDKNSMTDIPAAEFDNRLSNTLIDSKPPLFYQQPSKIEKPTYERQHQEQDLGELYQRFIDAQHSLELTRIDYALFLSTIEKTKAQLIESYSCQGVVFDIVKEADQVALQPKIIR